jgi:O-antigen/teichoic acid export membrane protein
LTGSRTLANFAWTAAAIGVSSILKFGQNVVLAHLLLPEILGIMVVVNAVRLGVELLTDVGIEQNIVHHPDGLDPSFLDTAWTLQVIRGGLLGCALLVASPFLAEAYGIDVRIFALVSLAPLLGALHSTAIFALVKQLEVRRRSLFEVISEVLAAVITVSLVLWWRSVWAPVVGLLVAVAVRSALSFLLPSAGQRFAFDRAIIRRIVRFGKWIAVTSLVMYAATNFDRLYLASAVPLATLGIYGVARAIAELPTTLARRISYQVIFPSLAGAAHGGVADGHAEIGRTRLLFALAACSGVAAAAGCADLLIALIYDPRYQQAGWMLAVLLLGGVFAILSNLNEALLLAAGRPALSSYANLLRFGTLAAGLVAGFAFAGLPGAVVAVALAELCQYGYIALGQLRIGRGFWREDPLIVICSFGVFAAIVVLRDCLGWGTPFAGIGGAIA